MSSLVEYHDSWVICTGSIQLHPIINWVESVNPNSTQKLEGPTETIFKYVRVEVELVGHVHLMGNAKDMKEPKNNEATNKVFSSTFVFFLCLVFLKILTDTTPAARKLLCPLNYLF